MNIKCLVVFGLDLPEVSVHLQLGMTHTVLKLCSELV